MSTEVSQDVSNVSTEADFREGKINDVEGFYFQRTSKENYYIVNYLLRVEDSWFVFETVKDSFSVMVELYIKNLLDD